MLYYEDMGGIAEKAVNHLSADFRAGLDEKDSARIKEASEKLPHNVVLEGIGNRMLIRDFLVQTKGELSKYARPPKSIKMSRAVSAWNVFAENFGIQVAIMC